MLAAFAAAGIEALPLPDVPQGITLPLRMGDLRQSCRATPRGSGVCRIEAAQRIAPLLDPRPEDKVLDVCAAPGGKAPTSRS